MGYGRLTGLLVLQLCLVTPVWAAPVTCLDPAVDLAWLKAPAPQADAPTRATAIEQTAATALGVYLQPQISAETKAACAGLLADLQVEAGKPDIVAANPALYAKLILDVADSGTLVAAKINDDHQDHVQLAETPAYQPPSFSTQLLKP